MRFLRLLAIAALIVGLVPAFTLFLVFSEKRTLNERFLIAVSGNDPVKISQLREDGLNYQKFCAEDVAGRFDSVCAYLRTPQNFELAAYGTLALGILALAMSIFVPLLFGRNRSMLAILFGPTVRIVTFSVGVAILLQGLLAAYAIYTLEVTAAGVYHPKLIAVVGLAGIVAGLVVLGATFSVFRSQPIWTLARRVDETLCPPLFGRLKALTGKLGMGMPDNVIVGLEPNFFVTTSKVKLHPSNEIVDGETLYLSLPLCRTFTVAELDAVIGHELGHFIGRDAVYSRRFAPAYVTLQRAMMNVAASGLYAKPALFMLELCMMQFASAERAISRLRELAADEVGSRVSSSDALVSSLLKVGLYAGLWPSIRKLNVDNLEAGKAYVNLSVFFAEASRYNFSKMDFDETMEAIAGATTAHPIDTHPPTGVRIQALGKSLKDVAPATLAVPDSSAAELFGNYESLEQDLTLEEHRLMVATGQAIVPDNTEAAPPTAGAGPTHG